ncbi:hypothetical protein ES332_D10G016500v1 [Gossypium tomentosum]|uniref:Uncharacterized protein n=1 Tax=Gossypium tomentosum TaxID=34277 RepID=A0A5D2J069_GOSTO|nr:hypothetical protein ES332_D10G016500v1 [Gossypium tomentosum]
MPLYLGISAYQPEQKLSFFLTWLGVVDVDFKFKNSWWVEGCSLFLWIKSNDLYFKYPLEQREEILWLFKV